MTLQRKPINGACGCCGASDFSLAEDRTEYSSCEWDAETKTFESTYSSTESSVADDAVRFFCTNCGAQHEVPEELV